MRDPNSNAPPDPELQLTTAEPGTAQPPAAEKRQFVEPAVTSPEDVLECTTFFQLTDSSVP